jgi:glycosyltransferase involved in cell wall biosynthesis
MRVCYFGTYDEFNPRNQLIISSLRKNDVDVIECHTGLWESTAEKMQWAKSSGWRALLLLPKLVWTYLQLALSYVQIGPHDVLVIGYIGQIDVFLAKILTLLTRKPLILDAYQSLYDTLVGDRQLVPKRTLRARVVRQIDRWSCAVADVVLLDTETHIDHFCREFTLPKEKFRRVFVSADDTVFTPLPVPCQDGHFTVTYFGGYIPLHGTDSIIRAAYRLRMYRQIRFELIGNGQTYSSTRALADELCLDNISFVQTGMPGRWLSAEELRTYVAQADVCLGVFGTGEKVDWVIPSKIYVALSMRKPVITADSPAVREVLVHGQSALLCERGDPISLAAAIESLWEDRKLRDRIAEHGHKLFSSRLSPAAIGRDLSQLLQRLAGA